MFGDPKYDFFYYFFVSKRIYQSIRSGRTSRKQCLKFKPPNKAYKSIFSFPFGTQSQQNYLAKLDKTVRLSKMFYRKIAEFKSSF
jgi:hypothetical protein